MFQQVAILGDTFDSQQMISLSTGCDLVGTHFNLNLFSSKTYRESKFQKI